MGYLCRVTYILSVLIIVLLTTVDIKAISITTGQNNRPPTIDQLPDLTIEAGDIRSLTVTAQDPDGNEGLKLTLIDPPAYASLTDNGNGLGTITLSPACQETQSSQINIRVTDPTGLIAESSFTVMVTPNQAPPINLLPDVTISNCDLAPVRITFNFNINSFRISILSGPSFVSLQDNGNGNATIVIAPSITDRQGGRVTLQITDACGLTVTISFNVTVTPCVVINNVGFDRKNFFIAGTGFNSSGAMVTINGQDVSARIIGQSDNAITLKGGRKKLNLRIGTNTVVVTSGGVTSNTATFTLGR